MRQVIQTPEGKNLGAHDKISALFESFHKLAGNWSPVLRYKAAPPGKENYLPKDLTHRGHNGKNL